MATIGLYHPFIHFKDDAWLKLSALYWDRMARIVPPSYWSDQRSSNDRNLWMSLGEAVR